MSAAKYPRTLHLPNSPGTTSDDRFHTNPSFLVGKEVVVTEKIDGGNTCLHNGNVYARSTGQPSTAGWFAMVKKHHAWKTHSPDCANKFYYGEDIYGVHSIEYNPVSENETYRLFGVREIVDSVDRFLSWDEIEFEAELLELPIVPVLFRGVFNTLEDLCKFAADQTKLPSSLGGEREGVVIRIADAFETARFELNVVKFVRANHVQTDEHWTRNWQACKLNTA